MAQSRTLSRSRIVRWVKGQLAVVALFLGCGCASPSRPSHDVELGGPAYDIHALLVSIQREKQDRDQWLSRITNAPVSVLRSAREAANQVYPEADFDRDVERFVELLLRRLEAVHAEAEVYRGWFFRDAW